MWREHIIFIKPARNLEKNPNFSLGLYKKTDEELFKTFYCLNCEKPLGVAGDEKIFDQYFTDAFFTFKGMSVKKTRSFIRKAFHFKGFNMFLKINLTCSTNMWNSSLSAFTITDPVPCFALWNQALTSIYQLYQEVFLLPSNTFCSLK